ncbi:MAG: GspH/FimT family pseudopilin [Rhodanobacter sp.]
MKSTGNPYQAQGTTLIEQIMVLTIMAVLTSIAVPPLHRLLSRDRLQVAQTDFMAALQNARATAATTGMRTMLCPSRDGATCSDEGRWDGGWLMGHDNDHDDQPDHGPLHVGAGYHHQVIIRSSVGRHIVRFRPDGSARGSNLTVLFCAPDATGRTLAVVVSNSGRIRGAPGTGAQAASCTGPDG